MAQNVISTAILIIAAVVATVALINGVFPAISQMSGSMTSVSDASNDRLKTEIIIICESANETEYTMNVYVKNTGETRIPEARIARTDVYFGAGAALEKCRGAGSPGPTWSYGIAEGNGDRTWDPGETLNVWIRTEDHDFRQPGQRVKIVLYNGVGDEDTFAL